MKTMWSVRGRQPVCGVFESALVLSKQKSREETMQLTKVVRPVLLVGVLAQALVRGEGSHRVYLVERPRLGGSENQECWMTRSRRRAG